MSRPRKSVSVGGELVFALERRPREHLEERRDPLDPGVEPAGGEPVGQPIAQALAEARQALVSVRRQVAQGRQAGRSADGIAVERPAVAQRAGPPGVEAIHDLGPAAERSERIAATDDLAQRRQVRPDADQTPWAPFGPIRKAMISSKIRTAPIRSA